MMIRMSATLIDRPTSGATADELAAQLRDVRTRTRRLTEDLSTEQLMGPMLPIVNPVLWEIGHIGWFHEYWTLRHAPAKRRVSTARTCCGIRATSPTRRAGISTCPTALARSRYMADVLGRQEDLLSRGVDERTRYFYELSIRHEDMHVEALAYMRQTLGYARPAGLGHPAVTVPGRGRAMPPCPADAWRLGSTAPKASSSTTRNGRTRSTSRRSASPAPP